MAGIRDLQPGDRSALARFAVLASFPPWAMPEDGARQPGVRRWVDGWPRADDLGVGWEDGGALVGAAWARRVEPVVLREAAGAPVPEVVVALEEHVRGKGRGTALVAALVERAAARRWPALVLTVSPRNPAGVAAYRRCGFVEVAGAADAEAGLLVLLRELPAAVSSRGDGRPT